MHPEATECASIDARGGGMLVVAEDDTHLPARLTETFLIRCKTTPTFVPTTGACARIPTNFTLLKQLTTPLTTFH